jgi:AAA-like domain
VARYGGTTDLLSDAFTAVLFGKRETGRSPVRTSTNQAEAIYLPTAAPGLGDSGVIIGREVYSGKGYVYDPFQMYGQQLPAPHWLVLGESGNGKSSLEKTYVLRQLRFRDRQVVVLDAQGEDGVGEWNLIARALGVTPIRLDPHHRVADDRHGAGIRLNPLDPAIAATGQLALLRTIVEVALGHTLDERSGYALKAAHATVRADALRAREQPILHDVVEALREPKPLAADEMNVGLDDVRDWGLDVALVLDRLVDGDLAGMFDGPTTAGIDLDAPLIVFDLSTIDRNSIAMPILMAIVGVWLEHTWIKPDRKKRIFLVEEAWHIINSPAVAQLFQRLLKFGRRLGLSFVAVVHHLSDVVDGAAAKEAAAILKMASTRTIYMQKSDEARATGKVLGLPRWAAEIIPTLTPGIAVWDVNGDVQVVKHIITEAERPLVYTDRAMTESSAQSTVLPPAGAPSLPPAARRPVLSPASAPGARPNPPLVPTPAPVMPTIPPVFVAPAQAAAPTMPTPGPAMPTRGAGAPLAPSQGTSSVRPAPPRPAQPAVQPGATQGPAIPARATPTAPAPAATPTLRPSAPATVPSPASESLIGFGPASPQRPISAVPPRHAASVSMPPVPMPAVPTSAERAGTQDAPAGPIPVERAAGAPALAKRTPGDRIPTDRGPVERSLVERGPVDHAPGGQAPARRVPIEPAPRPTSVPAPAAGPVPAPLPAAPVPPRSGEHADDSEMTALAAAIFGPRVGTPTHPRP